MRHPFDDLHEARRSAHWPRDYVEARKRERQEASRLRWAEWALLVILLAGIAFTLIQVARS